MPNYQADPDIRTIYTDGRIGIPDGLDPGETARLALFMRCDRVVVEHFLRDEQPPEDAMKASVQAAIAIYEQRSDRLPIGWQKFVVLQAGLLGIELDSGEIMEWAYRLCKNNAGWLGDFDDDIDREMPLRAMTQSIPAMSMIHFREGPPDAPPALDSQRGDTPTSDDSATKSTSTSEATASGVRAFADAEKARDLLRRYVEERHPAGNYRRLGGGLSPRLPRRVALGA